MMMKAKKATTTHETIVVLGMRRPFDECGKYLALGSILMALVTATMPGIPAVLYEKKFSRKKISLI